MVMVILYCSFKIWWTKASKGDLNLAILYTVGGKVKNSLPKNDKTLQSTYNSV